MDYLVMPFEEGDVRLTSPYGKRTLNGAEEFHSGVDLVGCVTDQVVAAAPGRVAVSAMVTDRSNRSWEWGNYVRVDGDDGRRYYYCHLASRAVTVGQRVRAGDHIGRMGETGRCFGRHLHFEVRGADQKPLNAAYLLGVTNRAGIIAQEDYRGEVIARAGLGEEIAQYIDRYPFGAAAWRKLYFTIRGGKKTQ